MNNKKIVVFIVCALCVFCLTIGFVFFAESARKETLASEFARLARAFRPTSTASKRWAAVANSIKQNGITEKVQYGFDSKTAEPGK